MGILDTLSRLRALVPLTFGLVPVPPSRVDPPEDASACVEGKHYVRLWLTEVQHGVQTEGKNEGLAFFARSGFQYGTQLVAIPTFLGPSSFGTAASATRLSINHALTPLFPYRGGGINCSGALLHTTGRAEGSGSALLEQLSGRLSSAGFSRLLDLSDIISDGIQGVMRESKLHLGFASAIGRDAPAQGRGLAPGYFVVFKPSAEAVIDPETLCVMNGSLRVIGSGGFPGDTQPLPAEKIEYLLLRVERLSQRPEGAVLAEIGTAWQQVMDAARLGDDALIQEAFKRAMSAVLLSRDLTEPDKDVGIAAMHTQLSKMQIAMTGNAGASKEIARLGNIERASVEAASAAKEGVAADLAKERQLERAAEQAAATEPFPEDVDHTVLVFECKPDTPLRAEIDGLNVFLGDTLIKLNVSNHARRADEAFSGDWRFKMTNQGTELLEALSKDQRVWEPYTAATQGIADRRLRLRFRGTLEMLRVPFEFLIGRNGREHLVLRHPLGRTVMGEGVPFRKRQGLSRRFFNGLYRRGADLNILAIASNTPPELPRVDHEVRTLSDALPDMFRAKGINVRVKPLLSEDATYDTVINELRSGKYDIVHYAGHGVYDEKAPEESHLPLHEARGRSGGIKPLKVPALKSALEESKVRFVYLSCCVGAAQGEPFKLQDYDFLGITDGLLQAGIPSVLGYRWPVVDSGGEKLAIAFYRYLAQEGETDTALLLARREISENRDDRSWVSPVLLLQA